MGREDEARALKAALGKPGGRIALVGPGGCGKTRLVREVLPTAVLCDLTGCSELADLVGVVATALGVTLQGEDDDARLSDAVDVLDRPLILDCCEGMLDRVTALVAGFPDGASVVLTSRIRPMGWRLLELPMLSVPVGDDLAAVSECDSGRLFLDCVRRHRQDWSPDPAEAPVIAAVLRRLEGLPLAIELAASRLRMMGAKQLLDHLDDRFALLRDGATSLVAVLESSWALLDAEERELLQQLSWFRGGFDLDAVLALDGASLDGLQALLDRSMVRSWELPRVPGERWFALYDSVREFALTCGEATPRGPWLGSHALGLVRKTHGEEALSAMEGLATYSPDLRRTLTEALASGDGTTAHRAVLALDGLLKTRGPANARAPLFRKVRLLASEHSDEILLAGMDARAFHVERLDLLRISTGGADARVRGWSLRTLAQEDAAAGRLEAALGEARAAVDQDPEEPRNLTVLAGVHAAAGDRTLAVRAYHRALAAARDRGAKREVASVLGFLAIAEHELGRADEASQLAVEAIAALDGLGDRRRAAIYSQVLGEVELARGALGPAKKAFEEAASRLASVGESRWRGHCLAGVAVVQAMRGEDPMPRIREALAAARTFDSPRAHGMVACWVSVAAALTGHLDEAESALSEATDEAPKVQHARLVARTACDLARAQNLREHGDEKGAAQIESEMAARLARQDGSAWSADARILLLWVQREVRERSPNRLADLIVHEAEQWFVLPGAERVSLATRHPNRRVLARLLQAHQGGMSVRVEELLEAGWPGERVAAESGAARVYTAVSTLRRWGLKELIIRVEDGYALRPDALIERA